MFPDAESAGLRHRPTGRSWPSTGQLLKPEVIWNVEKGLALSAEEIGRGGAPARHAWWRRRAADFFADLRLAADPRHHRAGLPGLEQRYLAECDGQAFETYIDWLAIAFAITLTGCPALSLPCGFTEGAGLPIGLQLVGPPRGEAALISAAGLLERRLGFAGAVPIDPRHRH